MWLSSPPAILLRSLRHHSKANCRTQMADIETSTTNDSTHRVWNSLWLRCLRVGFRCQWYFDLDVGVQINSIEQPIKRNSVGSGNVSHCGTSAFNDHLDYSFIVFEHTQQSFLMRRLDNWGNTINILQHVDLPLEICDFFQYQQVAPFCLKSKSRFQKQTQLDPIIPEQANHPISIQCPKRWFQILLNCAKHQFVSYTSNLWEQMYDFQQCTMLFQKWISNLQDLPAKSESWNSPSLHCLAVLPTWQYCLYSHVMMNIWIQSIQAFVTGFCPFCDWSCKFIHWP